MNKITTYQSVNIITSGFQLDSIKP